MRADEHSCAHLGIKVTMNLLDKLEREQRLLTVKEVAAFLGYSVKHIYRLIRQGKIEGWMKVEDDGDYKFCPIKFKAWIEKRFNGKDNVMK